MSRVAPALPFSLLVITDDGAARGAGRGVLHTLMQALLPEAADVAVVVRMKGAALDDVERMCTALLPVTRKAGARLFVHTHHDLVSALGLDGVHLDSHADHRPVRAALPAGTWVSASRHAGDALDSPALDGLDAVTLSPVYPSVSKDSDHRATLGLDGLRAAALTSSRPLIALGGLGGARAASCRAAGAAAVAVIGAVMAANDPRAALVGLRAGSSGSSRRASARR